MPFPPAVKEEALVRSRRCCCVCHDFAGLYTNVHHIRQEADGGSDSVDNAIVLCLRCHGEAGHYNERHPIGNKYSEKELRQHRDKWWNWCDTNPGAPLPRDPVSISPASIALGSGEWRARSLIKISNKTDDVYYQVIVKIVISTAQISTSDISIRIRQAAQFDETDMAVGPLTVNADMVRMDGVDSAGLNTIFLWLNSLDPKSTCTLVLENKSSYMPGRSEQPRAQIKLCGFDREPGTVLHSVESERIAVCFSPPETFTMKSVSLLMKRS